MKKYLNVYYFFGDVNWNYFYSKRRYSRFKSLYAIYNKFKIDDFTIFTVLHFFVLFARLTQFLWEEQQPGSYQDESNLTSYWQPHPLYKIDLNFVCLPKKHFSLKKHEFFCFVYIQVVQLLLQKAGNFKFKFASDDAVTSSQICPMKYRSDLTIQQHRCRILYCTSNSPKFITPELIYFRTP